MWGSDGNPMFKRIAESPNLTGAFVAAKDAKLDQFIIEFTTILVANNIPESNPMIGTVIIPR